MVRAADDHQLARIGAPFMRIDQIMKPFFGNEAADRKDVGATRKAEPRQCVAGRLGQFRRAVRDVNDPRRRSREFALQPLRERGRNRDQPVGARRGQPLAEAKHLASDKTPFGAVIILAVMGDDHAHAEQPRQWRQQRRTDGVDMDHLGARAARRDQRVEGRSDRLEGSRPRGRDRHDRDSLIVVGALGDIGRARIDGDRRRRIERLDPRQDFLAMRFHPAHHAGDAAQTGNRNLHRSARSALADNSASRPSACCSAASIVVAVRTISTSWVQQSMKLPILR